jgi:hypothetical protein
MMMVQSEAAKLFHNEVRDKKKTASGVHHKTGKNGYVGTMRFPSDIMSRSEKMRYRRSSKVMISNMYDQIIPIEDFEKLETHEQRNMLAYWRNVYSNKEITEGMGIWNNKYYKIVAELGLPKAPRINSTEKKPRKAKAAAKVEVETSAAVPAPKEEIQQPIVQQPQEIIVDGLHLIFNGTYKAEQIQMKLNKFYALLDDEEDDFYIEMKIVQKQPKK